MLATRPWWDRLAFPTIVVAGAIVANRCLSKYELSFRVVLVLIVASLLGVGCSLVLDTLRRRFDQ